jgi:hypothetical protein
MTVGHAKRYQETVDEEVCNVIVAHKSKAVWIAYGNFRGKPLDGSGSSESAALSDWLRRANYEANS